MTNMDDMETPILSTHDALVAVMVVASAADEEMRTSEMRGMRSIIRYMPIFQGYDVNRISVVTHNVLNLFDEEDGLDAFFELVRAALPGALRETAYAFACEIVVSDAVLREIETEMLDELRLRLEINSLHAAALEHAARIRHNTLADARPEHG